MDIFLFLELWCAGFALPVRNTVHTKAQMENFIALFYYSQCLYTVQQQKQARKNTIYICLELFYTVKLKSRYDAEQADVVMPKYHLTSHPHLL